MTFFFVNKIKIENVYWNKLLENDLKIHLKILLATSFKNICKMYMKSKGINCTKIFPNS